MSNYSKIFENLKDFFILNKESLFKNKNDFFKSMIFLNDSDHIDYKCQKESEKYDFYKKIIDFFDSQNSNLKKIAIDGAFKSLKKFEINPDLILGDFDSIDFSEISQINNDQKKKFFHLPDQNYCDFEKSIKFCNENTLLPSLILGINGGSFDRIIHNLHIFLKISKNLNFGICDDQIFFTIDSSFCSSSWIKIFAKNNSRVSIFGFQSNCGSKNQSTYKKTSFETKGLKWNVSKENGPSINFGCINSIQSLSNLVENKEKNKNKSHNFEIKVFEGKILVLISLN
jgi:thiamine pyrophosphokinase